MNKLIMTGALAMGIAFGANADDWFDANIGGYTEWPPTTAGSVTNGSWSANAESAASYADGKLSVDADTSSPLVFEATSAKTINTDTATATYKAKVKFTPFTELPEVPEGAKAAMIMLNTSGIYSFKILAKEGDGESYSNNWTDVSNYSGTVSPDDSYDVVIALSTDGDELKASYGFEGDTTKDTVSIYDGSDNPNKFQQFAVAGCGDLSSLSGEYQPLEGTIILKNLAAQTPPIEGTYSYKIGDGEETPLDGCAIEEVPYGKTVVIKVNANDGYFFADGTTSKQVYSDTPVFDSNKECDLSGTITIDPISEGKAELDGTTYFDFNAAFAEAEADDTITLKNGNSTISAVTSLGFALTVTSGDLTKAALAFSGEGKFTLTAAGASLTYADDGALLSGETKLINTTVDGKKVEYSEGVYSLVNDVPAVESVMLNKSETTIKVDASEKLTVEVLPAGAVQTVTWESDNTEVATVDANGLVTAVAVGTATITVTSTVDDTKKATCTVTVEAAVSTATVTITFGDGITKVTINDTVLTESGDVTLNQGTAYTAVAEYAEWYTNGTFTAVTGCSAEGLTITANAGADTATASIAASKIDPTVIEGTTAQAKAALGIDNKAIVNRPTLNASVNWAKNNGFTKTDINGLKFTEDGDPATGDTKAEAFLLNTNTDGLAAAKAEFKVTSITFDENGDPVLGEPTATYNGNIVKYGSATPIAPTADGWTKVTDENKSTFKFFEFKLQLNTTQDN